MNRINRLTAILIQLQTKHIVGAKEIAQRYGISLRTVYRDIRALEDAGVPIGSEPGKGYFIVEGYHLPPVMFNKDEAGALFLGEKLTEKFSDISVRHHYAAALDKIKAVLDKGQKSYMDELSSHVTVLPFRHDLADKFPNCYLSPIEMTLGQNRMIRIQYHSRYKDEETRRLVEPLGLCFYNSSWHLLGYCHLRDDYRDFRVDRIKGLKVTQTPFKNHRHEPLHKLIQKLITPSNLKTVIVRFHLSLGPFLQEQKYYFGFVEERITPEFIEMQFLVAGYEYFAKWILAFIDQVEIVSPNVLKTILQDYSKKLFHHYHPESK